VQIGLVRSAARPWLSPTRKPRIRRRPPVEVLDGEPFARQLVRLDCPGIPSRMSIPEAGRAAALGDTHWPRHMAKDALAERAQCHLGCSGTRAFLERIEAAKGSEQASLIGQFGIGFCSAFMVADRIDVSRACRRRAGVAVVLGRQRHFHGDGVPPAAAPARSARPTPRWPPPEPAIRAFTPTMRRKPPSPPGNCRVAPVRIRRSSASRSPRPQLPLPISRAISVGPSRRRRAAPARTWSIARLPRGVSPRSRAALLAPECRGSMSSARRARRAGQSICHVA
jgi:hypothetical protein